MCLVSRARQQLGTLPGPLLRAEAGFLTAQRLLLSGPSLSSSAGSPPRARFHRGNASTTAGPTASSKATAAPQLVHPERKAAQLASEVSTS